MSRRTFVTVGAGQTAAVAARTLRRRGFDGRIVLIGDEPNAPYQRPPLSKEFSLWRRHSRLVDAATAGVAGQERRRNHHRRPGDAGRSGFTLRRAGRAPIGPRRRGAVRNWRQAPNAARARAAPGSGPLPAHDRGLSAVACGAAARQAGGAGRRRLRRPRNRLHCNRTRGRSHRIGSRGRATRSDRRPRDGIGGRGPAPRQRC